MEKTLRDFKTTESDLPLVYVEPLSNNMITLSWLVNDAGGKVPGEYMFAEQDSKGAVIKSGRFRGLKAVNDMRNSLIATGWKFAQPPKLTVKDSIPLEKKEVEKKLPRKSRVYNARKQNPGETFSEMKARIAKNH